ncbi:hypothetical protein ScPMuIL_012933 [Solemya velum]
MKKSSSNFEMEMGLASIVIPEEAFSGKPLQLTSDVLDDNTYVSNGTITMTFQFESKQSIQRVPPERNQPESHQNREQVAAIIDALDQEERIISVIDAKILQKITEEETAQEILEADKYMFNLEAELQQIHRFIKSSGTQLPTRATSTSTGTDSNLDPNVEYFLPSPPADVQLYTCHQISQTSNMVNPSSFVTTGMELTPSQYQKAMKLCKFASSALQYEDSKTAIINLQKALRLLTTGQES